MAPAHPAPGQEAGRASWAHAKDEQRQEVVEAPGVFGSMTKMPAEISADMIPYSPPIALPPMSRTANTR